jgi:L-lactate dehydrogenase complex protein LldG
VVAQATMSPRGEILAAVRAGIAGVAPPPEPPRGYRRSGRRPAAEVAELFAERVAEYRARVVRLAAPELPAALADACRERGATRLGVPADLPDRWRPDGVELVVDRDLAAAELDRLDGALTGCGLGIAETGTVVLDGGPAQGRRALSLVPDYHLCVVREEQLVELVPQAIERLEPAALEGRPITFVSGPSATSDIELSRVEGVHGPRTLDVFLVGRP